MALADQDLDATGASRTVLEDRNHRFSLGGHAHDLELTSTELICTPRTSMPHLAADAPRRIIALEDVIGAQVVHAAGKEASLRVFCYPRKSPQCGTARGAGERHASHVLFEVRGDEDADGDAGSVARAWRGAIQTLAAGGTLFEGASALAAATALASSEPRPRTYLVFINPFSGSGRAVKLYQTTISTMLQQAGVQVEQVVTEAAGHAGAVVAGRPAEELEALDAIVCVGGDGILHEVIQGLRGRADGMHLLRTLHLAVIKAGSGNGLATAMLKRSGEALDVISSTFNVLKGCPHPMDLSLVETSGAAGGTYLSFLSLTWGLISDVDVESEVLRWMGEARLTLYALYRFTFLRTYPARLWICEVDGEYDRQSLAKRLGSAAAADAAAAVKLPPLSEPLVDGAASDGAIKGRWRCVGGVDGQYIGITIAQSAWLASDLQIAPEAGVGDSGLFHVLVLRAPLSRARLLQLFLEMEVAGHTREPLSRHVDMFKALAYRIEPLTEKGIYSLDGEAVPYGGIQAAIMPGAAKVLRRS